MGFFSKEDEVPKLPPNKFKRKECWDSRDKFFECLTKNGIDNSMDPKEKSKVDLNCGDLLKEFEGKCVASWVKHFQDKRFNDLVRSRYIEKLQREGAEELPFKLENRK